MTLILDPAKQTAALAEISTALVTLFEPFGKRMLL